MRAAINRALSFALLVGSLGTAAAQQPPNLPGPASEGGSILMAPYSSTDNTATCTAFVVPLGEAPYGLDVRKKVGPFGTADEAELSLKRSGWTIKTRFNQGGSQWLAASGCM
jgi:hypothetical protein